jgi:hypothetical protein
LIAKLKAKVLVLLIALLIPCLSWASGSQQTSGVTAQTIMDRARNYLSVETTSDYWTDARLLPLVNAGVVDIVSITKCLETNETVTLLTGVSEYALSTSYLGVESVIYSGVTTEYNANPLKALKRVDIKEVAHRENVGEPVDYYLWSDRIGFDPIPASGVSGYKAYVYMTTKPSALSATSAVPTPAQYDDALVLFVAYRALWFDGQFAASGSFQQEYAARLARFKADYVQRPSE